MRVIERVIEYTGRPTVITITPLGDTHFGNAATDERLIKKVVREIADDPMHFWIGGGDYCEFINRKDWRHNEERFASWLWGVQDVSKRQIEKAKDTFDPIKDDCLGLIKGTHELDILKKYERDVYATLVEMLKPSHDVPIMLGLQGFIRLRLRRMTLTGGKAATWTVVIYCHHGYGAGRMEGGDALALGRVFKAFNCDVALMWHRHKRRVIDQSQVQPSKSGNKILERYQVAAFCGAFLKSYSEDEVYPEEKQLPPMPLGPIQIKLHPAEQKIWTVVRQW